MIAGSGLRPFGYGYLALPLTPAKTTTDGANVPTGDHSWTLFLSTKNFKGPVAFFTPYFWSRATVKKPEWAGKLLDSRPSQPNEPFSMETAYIPVGVFEDAERGRASAPLPRCSSLMRMATPW